MDPGTKTPESRTGRQPGFESASASCPSTATSGEARARGVLVSRAVVRRAVDAIDPSAQIAGFLLRDGVVRSYRWAAGADAACWDPATELLRVHVPARAVPLLEAPLRATMEAREGMLVCLLADDGATYDLGPFGALSVEPPYVVLQRHPPPSAEEARPSTLDGPTLEVPPPPGDGSHAADPPDARDAVEGCWGIALESAASGAVRLSLSFREGGDAFDPDWIVYDVLPPELAVGSRFGGHALAAVSTEYPGRAVFGRGRSAARALRWPVLLVYGRVRLPLPGAAEAALAEDNCGLQCILLRAVSGESCRVHFARDPVDGAVRLRPGEIGED